MPRPSKDETTKNIILREDASIKWGNALVSGQWSLTLRETRLLFVLSSHIDRTQPEFECYRASVASIGAAMGLHREEAYTAIKETSESLLKKALRFQKPDSESWVGCPWFSVIAYDEDTSTLAWRFNEHLIPVLLGLRKAYVSNGSKQLIGFKGVYTSRWYLLALQWEKMGMVKVEIEDIRKRFELKNKYSTIGNFMTWFVNPAIEEINKFTSLHLGVETAKTGRKVTHLKITVTRTQQETTAPSEFIDVPKDIDVYGFREQSDEKQRAVEERRLASLKYLRGEISQTELQAVLGTAGSSSDQQGKMLSESQAGLDELHQKSRKVKEASDKKGKGRIKV